MTVMSHKSEGVSRSVVSTVSDLIDCILPGSSVHGILQARVLEYSLALRTFLTQGLNLGLPHYRQILYCINDQGSP